jgi:hypothetical protein
MLILFGGGDGGGIEIGPDGKIHRIPPWNPEIMLQLKAVSALTSVSTIHDATLTKEAGALAERLSTKVIPQVVTTAESTHPGDGSIAFVDGDGGFVCGSTGKHPIPIPPRPLGGNVFSPVGSREAVRI